MTPAPQLYGLIGFPLGHSFSKKYFTEKFEREGIANARYELFPIENVETIGEILAQNPDLKGLNVTIPHKQAVIPLLHDLDETARAVGAVNVIRIREGRLTGYNSDVYGFEQSLGRLLAKLGTFIEHPDMETFEKNESIEAFVLGTGGASKAVAYVLNRYHIPFRLVSRQPRGANQCAYEDLPRLRAQAGRVLWINTTPAGTYPKVADCPPMSADLFVPEDIAFDLIYNPETTKWMKIAAEKGAHVQNGLEMLHLQAEKAWRIWQETV